jgi:hypothetical protein
VVQGSAEIVGPATDGSASDTLRDLAGTESGRAAALLSSIGLSPGFGCERASKRLRMVTPDGHCPVRCKAPLKCEYCFRLARWELVTMMFEDATRQLPAAVLTLTTVDPQHAYGDAFSRAVALVIDVLRARWPELQYCGLIEFTTGKAPRSGGLRRMHMHALLKGVPADAAAEIAELARKSWQRSMGAHVVSCAALESCGGIIGYLGGLHHSKQAQRPPEGWQGRTLRVSRGYWYAPVSEVRAEARRQQAERRRLWAAGRTLGPAATSEQIEWEVAIQRERQESHRFRVVEVTADGLQPLREIGGAADRGKLTRYHPVDETAEIATRFWSAVRADRKARRAHRESVRSPRRESTTAPAPAAPPEPLTLPGIDVGCTAAARTAAPPHGRPRGGRAPSADVPTAPSGITGPAPPGALGHGAPLIR